MCSEPLQVLLQTLDHVLRAIASIILHTKTMCSEPLQVNFTL